MKISIIVPVYNESEILEKNVTAIINSVEKWSDYEIIIAEDGSIDGTDKIAMQLTEQNPRIRHQHSSKRLGKGLALKYTVKQSKGDVLVFMDIDLATSLEHLLQFINAIEMGYDMVIASRNMPGSYVERPVLRAVASLTYNFLVRILFRDGIKDHQTGFKAFRRSFVDRLVNRVNNNNFLFDTELIIKARQMGGRIIEIPVRWNEHHERTSSFRLVHDGIRMGIDLLRLRLNS